MVPLRMTLSDLTKYSMTRRHEASRGLSATAELLVMLPPVQTGRRHNVFLYRPFVCSSVITLVNKIYLKMHEPILLQIGLSVKDGTINFGVRKSKVEVPRRRS